MIRCNHCNEPIDHLDYREDMTVFGTVSVYIPNGTQTVDLDDWDENDRDGTNTTLTCPHCNMEVNTRQLIVETPPPTGEAATEVRGAFEILLDAGEFEPGEVMMTARNLERAFMPRINRRDGAHDQGQRDNGAVQDNTAEVFMIGDTTHCPKCNKFTRKESGAMEVECEHCENIINLETITQNG